MAQSSLLGRSGNGAESGHVRVYAFDGANWVQRGQDIDGEAAGDHSGSSVSLSSDGGIVAIGAPLNDGNGSELVTFECTVLMAPIGCSAARISMAKRRAITAAQACRCHSDGGLLPSVLR